MREQYEKKFLFCEWVIPTLVLGFVAVKFQGIREELSLLVNGIRPTLYGTLASLFGGLLGFVIAGVTILLTMDSTPRIQLLQESPAYRKLFGTFLSTTRWLAGVTFLCILGLMVDRDPLVANTLTPTWWFVWVATWGAVICLLRLSRSIWVLQEVIGLVLKDQSESSQAGSASVDVQRPQGAPQSID